MTDDSTNQRDRANEQFRQRLTTTHDSHREADVARRHGKGFRTARENLQDLVDTESFNEYGQFAVAAQRGRRDYEELQQRTAADGIITGTATINAKQFGQLARAAVIINDYTVLAGTQGYFHHRKIDRMLALAGEQQLPVVMYTEGGGGRPGDTDVQVEVTGLTVGSFATWSALSGKVLRIAVNNGYCFAGNAALFGAADIRIATRQSWIGMAGPAMIEGGGLGSFAPKDIGPVDVQQANGVIDCVVDDEAQATALAKKVLGYFQGSAAQWQSVDQSGLGELLPADRRYTYKVRRIIETLADTDSFTELQPAYGSGMITGFIRIEGHPMGLLCNDCQVLAGAIDSDASLKAARFIRLCNQFGLPLLSLCDTPGFMVGPDSEETGAVAKMPEMFTAAAQFTPPLVCIFLRKAYGLGAMAMAGGSLAAPCYSAAWPTGEFGPMGLEGAVSLGFSKELAEAGSEEEREALFQSLVEAAYERGKATEVAAFLEIDAVIDPAETRARVLRAMGS